MSRSKAALLGFAFVLGLAGEASAGPLREALERELSTVETARAVMRAQSALERERESLAWARSVLEHRGRESLRRLDAYRVSHQAREDQARARARAMYKLARGGMLRLYFEDVASRDGSTADRVTRGRTIRWLVRHDLRELSVHVRSEERARDELLSATREMAAITSLSMMQDMERIALDEVGREISPAMQAARAHRREIQRDHRPGAAERKLLGALVRNRTLLAKERGNDLLEPNGLRRPVTGPVVGRFGTYEDRVLRLPMERNGIELRAGRRERVRAAAAGTVALVGSLPGFDDVVVIDHGNGYLSLTARLQGIVVEEGQELERGALLGRVAPKGVDDGLGRTVYLELRHGERPIDPAPYLSGGWRPPAAAAPASPAADG
jgi:murein DD-endopeptidase MepM/ murein hydrolase activator NlpD